MTSVINIIGISIGLEYLGVVGVVVGVEEVVAAAVLLQP